MNRKEGYYWVKYDGNGWDVAFWSEKTDGWKLPDRKFTYYDNELDEIFEIKILPPNDETP